MKNKNLLMLGLLLAAVAAAIYCLTKLGPWELPDLGANSPQDYHTAATEKAHTMGSISKNEILLTETVEAQPDGGVRVQFVIFSLSQDQKPETFLKLTAQEARKDPALTAVGTASALFVGDNLQTIRNLTISHTS